MQCLAHGAGLPLPAYETSAAAGMDLPAAVPADEPTLIVPSARELIPTGFAIALPAGFEAQVRPRSGLAFRHGITVLNTPGTIDSDYRGEVQILLVNHGDETFTVERGMRVAQMIVAPVVQAKIEERDLAAETTRGSGGFGSTGRN